MTCTVFYSWQSQLPNATNRGFIEEALESAVRAVRADATIEVRPEVDRDTADVPGSPNIADTIRAKIDRAEIVICDVSIVQGLEGDGVQVRPTPNANVLIELGYAMKSLGTMERVVLVMNTAYGDISKLPFDLRQYRPTTCELSKGAENKPEIRKKFSGQLEATLRHVLHRPSRHAQLTISPVEQAIEAIEQGAPNSELLVKRYMERLTVSLIECAPNLPHAQQQPEEDDDTFIAGIASTAGLVAEFARVCRAISEADAISCARALYDGLTPIVAKYAPPRGYSGSFWRADYDYFKFLGHELLVSFTAPAIKNERWNLLDDVLRRELFVEYGTGPQTLTFAELYADVELLERRSERTRKVSVQADLIKERHSAGALGELVPIDQFVDADVFLFLRSELMEPPNEPFHYWFPVSVVYLGNRQPFYLMRGERAGYASQLSKALGCDTIQNLRTAYESRRPGWGRIYPRNPPLVRLNVNKLATR